MFQVLQQDPDANFGISTNKSQMVSTTTEMASMVNPDRKKALLRNMERRHGNSVTLSYDKRSHAVDRQKSCKYFLFINRVWLKIRFLRNPILTRVWSLFV